MKNIYTKHDFSHIGEIDAKNIYKFFLGLFPYTMRTCAYHYINIYKKTVGIKNRFIFIWLSGLNILYLSCKQRKKQDDMERKDIENDIQRIFKENRIWHDWDVSLDGSVWVSVDWGDWKHDHLYLDHVMRENGYILMAKEVTDEDGSDAYSAVHTFLKYEF